jgi:hypothetical protein
MDERQSARWLLRQRLLALAREMRYWKAVSRKQGLRRFWTHHSQIRAFAGIIHGISRAIYQNTQAPDFAAADAHAHAKDVLALFRIWEFFRSKLAQRLDDRYADCLYLADEFAWVCYKPAASKLHKEPPLVFLNGGFSPFILPRNRGFQAEFVPNELIQDETINEATERLPFPVIGVPWYQVTAPWELPVIAHEVGHSVEADLRLERDLELRIASVVSDPQRQARWLGWRSEIFADFFGCCAVGPAFVSNLADFLAGTATAAEDKAYPPLPLRLWLNFAFLGKQFANPVKQLTDRCASLLDAPLEYEKYANIDAPKVADALRTLDVGLSPFSGEAYQKAYTLASEALNSQTIHGLHDVREIVAALRIAYDGILSGVQREEVPVNILRLKQLVELLRQSAKPDIRASTIDIDSAAWNAAHQLRSRSWLQVLRRNCDV